jgi:tricorn protease
MVLNRKLPSPMAPESDEEGGGKDKEKDKSQAAKAGKEGEKAGGPKPVAPVVIDFAGLDQRIVSLPAARANYVDLLPGAEGVVYLIVAPLAHSDEDYVTLRLEPTPLDALRFELKTRKAEPYVEKFDSGSAGLQTFVVSADGTRVLYAKDKKWLIAPAEKAPKPGDKEVKELKMSGLEVWVDPRAEWRQMWREVWRVERDFLYDPGAHGLDLAAAERVYAHFLDGVASREDLNVLIREALSNLTLGHVYVRGGATPKMEPENVGLLGADYRIEANRYRFARVLAGENWNPKLRAPLTEPGVDVKEGEFLLAVNGQELRGDDDVSRLLLGTAGKQTILTVRRPTGGTAARSRSCRCPPRSGCACAPGWRTAASGSRSSPAGASATSTSPTRAAAGSRTSTATTSPRSARRRSSSTSASTTAGRSPTTW